MSNHVKLKQLETIVGVNNLLTDASSKSVYGKDMTQRFAPDPLAIVFPHDEQQIVALVQWANQTRTPLVPSGGRTGYSGGATAGSKELVVSLSKMNQISDFNPINQTVTCQPGVVTQTLQAFATEHQLYYPVDFASSGSSQIGGNIATNAGGIKVIRYGLTRDWVYGLRVVTGNGDLLELNHGLIKNASGYDLRHIFIGSEGTLGIITEATIKLTEPPRDTQVALFGVTAPRYMMDLLVLFREHLPITAFEFFSDAALRHVLHSTDVKSPFDKLSPFYILLEYETSQDSDAYLAAGYEKLMKQGAVYDAIISTDMQQKQNIWRLREEISMSLLAYFPYKYDISVSPSNIIDFMAKIGVLLSEYPTIEIIWFGHIGDGNLHLNLLKPSHLEKDAFYALCDTISQSIYACVQQYQGSVSAEHGIGLLKKDFLHFTRSEAEIGYMRAIKSIFDRNQIMNPGKLF